MKDLRTSADNGSTSQPLGTEHAMANRDRCRMYEGPDAYWALMGEVDWEIELMIIGEEGE